MNDRQGKSTGKLTQPSDSVTRPAPIGSPLVRHVNQGIVLAALRESGQMRLSELASVTGLSRPTIGTVVDDLCDAGWAEYAEEPSSGGAVGRPARLARFRADGGFVVGIDIGPHSTAVSVADLTGTVVASVRRATNADRSKEHLLAHVRSAVTDALREAGIARDAVLTAVVGSPGIVDSRSGGVVSAPGLPGWAGLNLRAELRRSFRCPVYAENDVNLALLGECWRGVAREASTAVFVLWGERLGAGIYVDGRLHRGAGHAAGEIGYLTVLQADGDVVRTDPDTAGHGPFERQVGAAAIRELGQKLAKERGGALAEVVGDLDAAAVFRAAADEDVAAAEVVDIVAERLARGLAPVLLTLDPDILIIGGGISRAGAGVLQAVRHHLRARVLVDTPVELSALGEDAVVMGALRFGLNDVESRLMPALPLR